jgi:hypothetical protein
MSTPSLSQADPSIFPEVGCRLAKATDHDLDVVRTVIFPHKTNPRLVVHPGRFSLKIIFGNLVRNKIRNGREMCVVCNDGFTFVDRCGYSVWYVARVSQSTKPAGVSHSFDAGHKWEDLHRQAKNFFKGSFTEGRSFGKIRLLSRAKI